MTTRDTEAPEPVADAPTKPEPAVSMLELVYGGMRVAAALDEATDADPSDEASS